MVEVRYGGINGAVLAASLIQNDELYVNPSHGRVRVIGSSLQSVIADLHSPLTAYEDSAQHEKKTSGNMVEAARRAPYA